MRRAAATCLIAGSMALLVGSLLPWATSEGGVPPTVESSTPISEDGGWTLLLSPAVCVGAGVWLLAGASRPRWLGAAALGATAWAGLVTDATTDPAALGNVSVFLPGPAGWVLLSGVALGAVGALLTFLVRGDPA